MPESYTVHDEPERVARIERDLAIVTEAVRDADPRLRSLVLTGGFARGEGAFLDGAPQNDYDFVAIRGTGRTKVPYDVLSAELEKRLGLHVDLSPVAAWRLRWASPTIFWYETALRGRVIWGEHLLHRIPTRSAAELDPAEALRLLANRAAGLLLVTEASDGHARRLQAAKAILAAADAHLLASGRFAPSQTERYDIVRYLRDVAIAPPALRDLWPWLEWAYAFKVEPSKAAPQDPDEAWHAAAQAVLDAVPRALVFAGLPSLEAYGRRDRFLDHLVYAKRARSVPGVRRFIRHPTGRVRVGTLRLLEASLDGHVRVSDARRSFGDLVREADDPVRRLDALRKATLQ